MIPSQLTLMNLARTIASSIRFGRRHPQRPTPTTQRPTPTAQRHQQGFTIIEVLVAMVLLAIGVVGTMRLAGMTSTASAQARDIIMATTLAQEMMNEIVQSTELTAGSSSGDFEPDHPEYRWESSIEASAEETGLLIVSVSVFWRNGMNDRKVDVTTQALDPAAQTDLESSAGAGTTTPAGATGGGGG